MNGIPIHVDPIASDGNWTIGYDDDGLAGEWPGNMTEITGDRDFMIAKLGNTFSDGNSEYEIVEGNNGVLRWQPFE